MSSLRRALWVLGAPARIGLVALIRGYRLTLSGWLGGQCRFYPSCSHYAEDAVRSHGATRGSLLTLWRIGRCGPFTDGGVDHVPPPKHRHAKYDVVLPVEPGVMIAFAPWQYLLDGLGWVVAQIYSVIPNYGLTIIALTVLIRVVLLPLGIRQVRSMQHMQIIQPKVKQIQQKYKQNRQRQQEEVMKLYKEYGVNPFSGCWPVLLQFPILIAMYSVLRFPQHPIHVPVATDLYEVVTSQIPPVTSVDQVPTEAPHAGGTSFLSMNLLCSASQAGDEGAKLGDRVTVEGKSVELQYPVDCGNSVGHRVPYYIFAFLMFATTFYQQRQMQKASPPGAASSQQQALLKIMPIMFGVFGIFFPVGLVLYWTTSNVWQIGQQHFMLKSRPTAEQLAQTANAKGKPAAGTKKGFMATMMERAEQQRAAQQRIKGKPGTRKPGTPKPGTKKPGTKKPGSGPRKPGGGDGGGDPKKRPEH